MSYKVGIRFVNLRNLKFFVYESGSCLYTKVKWFCIRN